MTSQRRLLVCALALSLAGCTTPRRVTSPQTAFWSGRMGLQLHTDPPQNFSAGFELHGSPEQGELRLLSPVGTTVAQLNWAPGKAQLIQGGHEQFSQNLDNLTAQITGTVLPIAALFDWLAGLATPAPGWTVDVGAPEQGRIHAQRHTPEPKAVLRIILEH